MTKDSKHDERSRAKMRASQRARRAREVHDPEVERTSLLARRARINSRLAELEQAELSALASGVIAESRALRKARAAF